MSVFSRIKTIGETDLSMALGPNIFRTDDLARYGLRGRALSIAFDPVQSLLAISTENGFIHVFGQQNVEVVFALSKPAPIEYLRIVKSVYLVAVDARNYVTVFNMETREETSNHTLYGNVSAVTSDPAMDWLFIGLENGQVVVFDVDRGVMSNYRIENLQKSLLVKLRLSPVIDLAVHPRDPSLILVCYTETAVLFNLIKQEIVFGLRYEVPAGAPGGDTDPRIMGQYRHPPLLRALWHPNGHHILTVHFDGSLVFWDGTEGNLLTARTLTATNVNIPVKASAMAFFDDSDIENQPITHITWNCTQNPEETSLLIAGGHTFKGAMQGLTLIDFGVTPVVAMTPYQSMGNHYCVPKRQRVFPTPEHASIIDFTMLPKQSPYYAGCHNPFALIALLDNGELSCINYPSGLPVDQVGSLPSAFAWVQPFVTAMSMTAVPRNQWLGMLGSVPEVGSFFIGGSPARRHLRRFENRNALCTGHADGTVRLWDASHGELETSKVIEISVCEAVKRYSNVAITHISCSGSAAELAVALENGQVVLYKFGNGKKLDLSNYMDAMSISDPPQIQDIRGRTTLKRSGFLPSSLINNVNNGQVTSLVNSHVGFVAIGYENGTLIVIDRRGPAVIFSGILSQLTVKKSSFMKKAPAPARGEHPTCMEFGIYMLGDEKYSSIVLSVGSSGGNLFTFRVVPTSTGAFSVQLESSTNVTEGPVKEVIPINMAKGTSSVADSPEMSQLAKGVLISGGVIVVSQNEIRLLKQPKNKLSYRNDVSPIAAAGISFMREEDSLVLTCITTGNETVYYALPSLKEITRSRLPFTAKPAFVSKSLVMLNGDAVIRQDQASASLINIWGRGIKFSDIPSDLLYDALKQIPARPTISTLQWIKGTPVAKIEDIDDLIGGPRRPPSKFMVAQQQADNEQRRLIEEKARQDERKARQRGGSGYNDGGNEEGGFFSGMSKTFDSIEEGTNEYLNSLSGVADQGKSSILKSAFKAKFF